MSTRGGREGVLRVAGGTGLCTFPREWDTFGESAEGPMAKAKQSRTRGDKRRPPPRPMTKPAMMDWALRLLRLLNERKVLTSRIVADEFGGNIRTAQRYLLYLSHLPCGSNDEEGHTDAP